MNYEHKWVETYVDNFQLANVLEEFDNYGLMETLVHLLWNNFDKEKGVSYIEVFRHDHSSLVYLIIEMFIKGLELYEGTYIKVTTKDKVIYKIKVR